MTAPAIAAPDAGLRLTVAPAPAFTVGSQGAVDNSCDFGNPDVWSLAQGTLAFSATSPSGITGYDIRAVYAGMPPGVRMHQATNAPVVWTATNYSDGCGGGSFEQEGWKITAHDSAGHAVTRFGYYQLQVTRWNNTDANDSDSGTWSFDAGWTRSNCSCADGGSQNYSTAGQRTATFRTHPTKNGDHLGLMMATGPGRGMADIYLDGVHVAVVDTFAATNINRIYEWDSGPLAAGAHTVNVVNRGTPGRPRIDVNAMSTFS